MRETRTRVRREFRIVCDCCGSFSVPDTDGEWEEMLLIELPDPAGDQPAAWRRCDLCQYCLEAIAGRYLRVSRDETPAWRQLPPKPRSCARPDDLRQRFRERVVRGLLARTPRLAPGWDEAEQQ